jgi:hypothetical protein
MGERDVYAVERWRRRVRVGKEKRKKKKRRKKEKESKESTRTLDEKRVMSNHQECWGFVIVLSMRYSRNIHTPSYLFVICGTSQCPKCVVQKPDKLHVNVLYVAFMKYVVGS